MLKQDLKTNKQKNETYSCQTAENEQGGGNIDGEQRKRTHYIQGIEMRKSRLLIIQARSQWSDIFKILKQNAVNQKFQAQ